MARRKKHEEHLNAEAWAIPYGDLVTLLLAFFVVMYAVSSVNEGKYRVLADSLAKAFKGTPRSLEPIQIGKSSKGGNERSTRHAPLNNAIVDAGAQAGIRETRPAIQLALGKGPRSGGDTVTRKPAGSAASARLQEIAVAVEAALAELVSRDLVAVRHEPFWLEVEIKADVLFPSGSASIADGAVAVIANLAHVLFRFENHLRVEGHTDDRPIRTSRFPSNWELSSARAAAVVHRFAEAGIDPRRLSVLGLGEHHPVADNETADGRNRNRRVTVVVLSEVGRQTLAESRAVDALRGPPEAPSAGAGAGMP